MGENSQIDNIHKKMTGMLNNSQRHTVSLQTQLVTKKNVRPVNIYQHHKQMVINKIGLTKTISS